MVPDGKRNLAGLDHDGAPQRFNADGAGAFLIVCEHASNAIPAEYGTLGLDDEALTAHIAWDPGALEVARRLSESLDAPLVACGVSRLIHDCNRPSGSPEAMPAVSEFWAIPGNDGLDTEARAERGRRWYAPFHAAVDAERAAVQKRNPAALLVTVHSFTPVYRGEPRQVEVGILHDEDRRAADATIAALAGDGACIVRRNEPYGPADGVTHTLKVHGLANGMANVMIEIRNDLIATAEEQAAMADWLALALRHAQATIAAQRKAQEGAAA